MRLGIAQPQSNRTDESQNVKRALEAMEAAKTDDVDLLCLPEGYPGPYFTDPEGYSPDARLQAKADELDMHVAYGRLEAGNGGYYVSQFLVGPDGKPLGTSRRRMPMGPPLYEDESVFPSSVAFSDLLLDDSIPVIETELGWNVAIVICSELFCPELTRVAALKGADLVLYPSGWLPEGLHRPWKLLTKARATENLVYTAVTQHRYARSDGREPLAGLIAGPESTLAESETDLLVSADLDLDRLEWLRNRTEGTGDLEYNVVPGLSNGQRFYRHGDDEISRRPELYGPLTMSPAELGELSARKDFYEDIPDYKRGDVETSHDR